MKFKTKTDIENHFFKGIEQFMKEFDYWIKKLKGESLENYTDNCEEKERENFIDNNFEELTKFFLEKVKRLKIENRTDGKDIDDLMMENDNDNKFEDWLLTLNLSIITNFKIKQK